MHAVCQLRITGDPAHDCFALRKLVSVKSADAQSFLAAHRDLMERLSLPPHPLPAFDAAKHVCSELTEAESESIGCCEGSNLRLNFQIGSYKQ